MELSDPFEVPPSSASSNEEEEAEDPWNGHGPFHDKNRAKGGLFLFFLERIVAMIVDFSLSSPSRVFEEVNSVFRLVLRVRDALILLRVQVCRLSLRSR
ncbi:hypothetical protein CDAR_541971 [Caerostris darwini]|uniref:Uncharacterized protein n=1 Tax=Caerostris darwini TaxID=1538125 RepID=A0AAV4UU69_9ARAC|nr:hypothetical protein CDAR_541971 [Caerostris darwini]